MLFKNLRRSRYSGVFVFAFMAIFLSAQSVKAGTEVQITNDSTDQFAPYIDGDRIVWEDWRNANNPEIYMYDLAHHAETRITDNSWGQYMPVVSGSRIFWTDFRAGNNRRDIYMYDLLTHVETNLINAPESQYVWNASGNRIVWKDNRDIINEIYTYNLVTQTETKLTNGALSDVISDVPAVSGEKVVWHSTSANWNWDYEVYVHDLTTQTTAKVTTDPAHNQQYPAISGDKIVWQDNRNGNEDIYMYDLATQTETQITNNLSNQRSPKISGDRVIWLDGRNHSNSADDIYMYDLATQTETRITTDIARADSLSLSGNMIVWQDWRSGRPDIYMYEIDTPPANIVPVAQIIPVATVILGQSVTFDGSSSGDSDGIIVSYDWDFGDGSTGAGVSSSHTYAAAGTYQVTLTVTDDDGAMGMASTSVLVNMPPVAFATSVSRVNLGSPSVFDGSASYDTDDTIVSYAWDFGDGSTASEVVASHAYAEAGMYQATLTVTDNYGATDSVTTAVSVNAPPLASILPVQPFILGETAHFDGSSSSDTDGSIVGYQWDFGDGEMGSGETVEHQYGSVGSYQVTLTVTDNDGAKRVVSVNVVVQVAAQAIGDLMGVVEDMNLTQGISNSLDSKLQNATDALEAANAGDRSDAINKLEAFINTVQAQSGNQLTVAQADQLIAEANRIISAIE